MSGGSKQVHIGIIGFGRIGAEHARWLSASGSARAVAAIDPTPGRRELAERAGLKCYDSSAKLLEDQSLDAILISSPTASHFEHAMVALCADKHVMIEKPMAVELDHARQLIEEARQRKLVLSVFHNRRWDIDFLTVKQAIKSGLFGKVFNIESRLGQWQSCVGPAAPEWRPGWRNEAAYGGGGLLDWGSHFLDQLWQLLHPARPVQVFAQLRGNVWSSDCDDLARVCIDFDNGAVGMVEINTTTTRPLPRWHIDGTSGSASSPFSLEYDTNVWAKLTFAPADGSAPRELPRAEPGLDPSRIWDRFASACHAKAEPAVTAESVLPTMMLLDAARRSAAGQRAVQFAQDG